MEQVGSVVVPVAPGGLFPAIGMHSLGEEVRLNLQAEWGADEEDSIMMVDSHEDEWGRLYDVKVGGTVSRRVHVPFTGGKKNPAVNIPV